jgi:antitoxin HigA-1
MPMLNPPHPGEIVREECLKPLGLSVTAAARALGISRKSMSELVNERAGISAMMAIRLARAFGGTAETWLGVQLDYELAQARRRAGKISVKRVRRAANDERRA